MGVVDLLRGMDRTVLRVAALGRTKASPPAAPGTATPVPEEAHREDAPLARGRVLPPRLRAFGWRTVAALATALLAVLAPLARHGLIGPVLVVVVGIVLTVWWGPLVYVVIALLTAGAWIWAVRAQPFDPTATTEERVRPPA